MKFRYYLFYKNEYYHLFDRKLNKDITFITFYNVYCYIKQNYIDFTDVYFKHLSLYALFSDYVTLEDKEYLKI